MTEIIGLLGAAGAGKSETAKILVNDYGFVRLRMADPLKAMLRTLGLTEAQIDGPEKNSPIPLLGGKTFRHAGQTLGTEWGRKLMDEDLWVRAFEQRLLQHLFDQNVPGIVVDDIRFRNEVVLLRRYGAYLMTVRRPSAEPKWGPIKRTLVDLGLHKLARVHVSETFWWTSREETDATVLNLGDRTFLAASLRSALDTCRKAAS